MKTRKNSIRNKFDCFSEFTKNEIDILTISETELDASFPKTQFYMNGFSKPYRVDRKNKGGGILLYMRRGVISKPIQVF